MELFKQSCKTCGGNLRKRDEQFYKCENCGNLYTHDDAKKYVDTLRSLLDEAKQEAVSNARRNLYDAVNAEYVSSTHVHECCVILKQLLPDDFQANFYETAIGNNGREIARTIRRINVKENACYMDTIVRFLINSLQSDYILETGDLIERAYKTTDLTQYERFSTALSAEAQKLDDCIYLTTYPRDVFVAYSSKDMDQVSELVECLEEQGLSCFVAARNLRHGKGAVENYEKALKEAMDNCRSFVFVSSPNSRHPGCDALKKEIPYIKNMDLSVAPAECRSDYAQIPHKYKKHRVEYRIQESARPVAADRIVSDFFDGYERVYSPDEVAERVLNAGMEVEETSIEIKAEAPVAPIHTLAQKKYCVSCRTECTENVKFCSSCGSNKFAGSLTEIDLMQKIATLEKTQKESAEKTVVKTEGQQSVKKETTYHQTNDMKKSTTNTPTRPQPQTKPPAQPTAQPTAKVAAQPAAKPATQPAARVTAQPKTTVQANEAYAPKKRSGGKWIGVTAVVMIAVLVIAIAAAGVGNKKSSPNDPSQDSQVLPSAGVDTTEKENQTAATTITPPYVQPYYTEGLQFVYDSEQGGYVVADYYGTDTTIVIPDTYEGEPVITIVSKLFYNTYPLYEVEIGANVRTIEEHAFSYCPNLKKVTISDAPASIGFCAFYGCENLEEVDLGSAITEIRESAFNGCVSLRSITIPGSAAKIGKSAFKECTGLASLVIQDGVTDIAYGAFYGCSSLESFHIPDSVKSIGDYAFSGCENVTDFSLGAGVESIGKWCFLECRSDSVYLNKNVTYIGEYAFDSDYCPIYCEMESQPTTWNTNWDYNFAQNVIWGYTDNQ